MRHSTLLATALLLTISALGQAFGRVPLLHQAAQEPQLTVDSVALAAPDGNHPQFGYDELSGTGFIKRTGVTTDHTSSADGVPGPGGSIGAASLEMASLPIDTLEAIVSQISPDSIESYIRVLESFQYRMVGAAANAQARDWLISKLSDYGYAPVLDTCLWRSAVSAHNVIAYKEGYSFPHYYIVIGAHYDVVPYSPGAGDDGAGVAGVLEIARILQHRNTHFTFVLSLFDAEEAAIVGSAYLADRLASNGDSVAIMLNMDEISWNAGTNNSVRLFYGSNQLAAQRFRSLAGLIPSVRLNCVLSGISYYSDHWPFQSCGNTSLFVLNYLFPSPVRHSSSDSSTYVNFVYVSQIVRGVAATALDIDDELKPALGLTFDYPDGLPDTVSGKTQTVFRVRVSGIAGGAPVPGTGQLHYALDNGAFAAVSMTDLGGSMYSARMPALGCGNTTVRYYVSAQESGGSTCYDPNPSQPTVIPITTGRVTAFADDFETDRGWSQFEGLWAIGSPLGHGGELGCSDPVGGRNSTNCLAYNLNGDYENSQPEMRVISPAIDCRGLTSVRLRFWRWLGIEQSVFDVARIMVSTDGNEFSEVWSNVQYTAGGYWMEHEIDISAFADNQRTVYVEFTMGPTDGGVTYCGWNVDDLEVYGYKCVIPCCQGPRGNVNVTGIVDLADLSALVSFLTGGGYVLSCPDAANVNAVGIVDLADLSALVSYLTGGGYVLPSCP